MQKILFPLFFALLLAISPSPSYALKTRVWNTTTTTTKTTTNTAVTNRPTFKVSFRADHRAIFVRASELRYAKSVSYELTYTGNGLDQGVVGAFQPTEPNGAERELLFATCSSGVCTYHKNLQNAQLVVITKTTSGKTFVKKYRIKV